MLEDSLAIGKQVADAVPLALGLARLSALQGDAVTARRLYEESLTLLLECHAYQENIAASLEGLAALEAGQGAPSLAARLWGAAEVLRETIGAPIYPVHRASYEQAVANLRTMLGEQAFRASWIAGRTMTPERALTTREGPDGITSMPQLPSAAPSPSYPAGLTAREVEVLRLIAQGRTDAQIAEHLVISPRTVNRHTTSLYSKLHVSSRAAATRYALEHHLL